MLADDGIKFPHRVTSSESKAADPGGPDVIRYFLEKAVWGLEMDEVGGGRHETVSCWKRVNSARSR